MTTSLDRARGVLAASPLVDDTYVFGWFEAIQECRRPQPAVQTHFLFTEVLATLDGGKVEIVVHHRTFEFPRPVAGEKDDGRMRHNLFNRCTVMGGR